MEIKHRLNHIVNMIGVSKNDLCRTCGLSKGQFFKYLNGEQYPGSKFMSALKEHYPWVSIDWLITGEGNPDLRSTEGAKVTPIDEATRLLLEVEEEMGRKLGPKQREAVARVMRDEIQRKQKDSKSKMADIIEAFDHKSENRTPDRNS